MIQCSECEFFRKGPNGEVALACDPFSTIKESDCLMKWQLASANQLLALYRATLSANSQAAPMIQKMFKFMEREIDDVNEADKWKADEDEDEWSPDEEPKDG